MQDFAAFLVSYQLTDITSLPNALQLPRKDKLFAFVVYLVKNGSPLPKIGQLFH